MSAPQSLTDQPHRVRRTASRLRLNLPARLILLDRTASCVIDNISQTGARLALESPPAPGEFGRLQCANIDRFFDTSWNTDHRIGVTFDEALPMETLRSLRDYSDRFPHHKHRELKAQARDWVAGETG
jgi:hypothetical protein